MQVTPRTDQQIAEMNLFPTDRNYFFEIIESVTFGNNTFYTEDTKSKSGNEMIHLVVNVFNDQGKSKVIRDYLLDSFPAKLRSAALACGLLDKYNAGHLYGRDFIGKKGKCRLRIEKSPGYADKNAIDYYLVADGAGVPMQPEYIPAGEGHMDVPF